MKKLTLSVIALSCFAANVSSHAVTLAESAYVSAKFGVSSVSNYDNKSSFTYKTLATSKSETSSVKLSDDSKTVFTGNIAYGVNFAPAYNVPVRLEVEYAYHDKAALHASASGSPVLSVGSLNIDNINYKHDLTLQSYMLNGYYDFTNHSRFTPYLSAGVGLAHTKLKTGAVLTSSTAIIEDGIGSNTKSHIALGVGAGFAYEISPKLHLDLGYRYLNGGNITNRLHYINKSTSDTVEVENKVKVDAHDVTLGLRYAF
ncbi:outer membrane protein [Acinetobacter sp. ANC 3791]|uniref:outer membrane protein n=1 Tax=Acinetobacter sp. ANC 3791 TaxID=2529836 RepID=UPI0010392ADF|nr:outer membrane beta-barrel protein [Acinetobacter sp. ANC 3791]TCB84949.1 porin family protein [Acinetobacter sp. ANC 3791]